MSWAALPPGRQAGPSVARETSRTDAARWSSLQPAQVDARAAEDRAAPVMHPHSSKCSSECPSIGPARLQHRPPLRLERRVQRVIGPPAQHPRNTGVAEAAREYLPARQRRLARPDRALNVEVARRLPFIASDCRPTQRIRVLRCWACCLALSLLAVFLKKNGPSPRWTCRTFRHGLLSWKLTFLRQ